MVDGIKARKKVALREKPQDMNIDIATDIIMILSEGYPKALISTYVRIYKA